MKHLIDIKDLSVEEIDELINVAKDIMANKPDFAVYRAVKGMLPKNSLGSAMLKKLRVYKGSEHPHQAQNPEVLKLV